MREQAQQLAASLDQFLGLFLESRNRAAQETHIRQVIMECAKLGYTVFSQPAELVFSFNSPQGLVTHPGLDVVRDEQGNRINPPRKILEPTVVSV